MKKQEKENQMLVCESCEKKFFCGAETGFCWCFDVSIEPQTLNEIDKKYKNCLCSDCLKNKTELILPK